VPVRWLQSVLARPGRSLALIVPLALLLGLPALRTRLGGSLLDLLPDRPVARSLVHAVEAVASQDLDVVLVEGTRRADVDDASERLQRLLARVPAVSETIDHVPAQRAADARARWRAIVLRSDPDSLARLRERFTPHGIEQSVDRIVALALAPGGGALRDELTQDPLDLASILADRFGHLGAGVRPDASGGFATTDGRARIVLVRVRGSAFDLAFCDRLAASLEPALRSVAHDVPGVRIRWTGPHAVARATRDLIRDDLRRSTILASILVTIVFALATRRLRALIAVGIPLAIGMLWTAAFAAVALRGLNAVTAAFGAVVLGVGLDTGVHLYQRILTERSAGASSRDAASRAVRELASPLLAVAATAAAAFASLAVSELRALRHLGLLAAIGELATAVAIVVLLPPIAALIERGAPPRTAPSQRAASRALARVAGVRGLPALVAFAAIAGVAVLALGGRPRLAEHVVLVRPQMLEPLSVQQAIFDRFGGESGQWMIVADRRDLESALRASEHIEHALSDLVGRGMLAGYDGVSSLLPSRERQEANRAEVSSMTPSAVADRLAVSLAAHGLRADAFSPGLGPLREPLPDATPSEPEAPRIGVLARRFLAERSGSRVVVVYLRPRHDVAVNVVRAAVMQALARSGEVASLTGYPLLEDDVRSALRADGLRIGCVAFVLVAIMLAITARSLALVLLALAGLAFEALLLAAFLCLARTEMNAFNLLVLPVLFGITLDEIIFVLVAYRRARGEPRTRAAHAVADVASASLATASATAAGFFALGVCRFDALRSMGIVAGVGTLLGLVCALIVVPALARVFDRFLPPE